MLMSHQITYPTMKDSKEHILSGMLTKHEQSQLTQSFLEGLSFQTLNLIIKIINPCCAC